VDGVCIISHGSSSARAMLNGIKVAKEMVDCNMVGLIAEALATE
jgi:glycerol-3-phosphate acyltransferase PlsX